MIDGANKEACISILNSLSPEEQQTVLSKLRRRDIMEWIDTPEKKYSYWSHKIMREYDECTYKNLLKYNPGGLLNYFSIMQKKSMVLNMEKIMEAIKALLSNSLAPNTNNILCQLNIIIEKTDQIDYYSEEWVELCLQIYDKGWLRKYPDVLKKYYFKNPCKLCEKIKNVEGLSMQNRCYEKTLQFDHPCREMSFYTKKVDGRFRVRITKNDFISECKLSWKKRLPSTTETDINKEEEVELNINYNEYENLMFIIENVLKMKSIESYERYRTIFTNNEVEIAVDEYPFGIAVEIENKSDSEEPQKIVRKWVKKLNMDIKKAYRLSWDDKYSELCKEQKIEKYNHVTFDLPMPQVID